MRWKNNVKLVCLMLESKKNIWHSIQVKMIWKITLKILSRTWLTLLKVFIEFPLKLKVDHYQKKNHKNLQILGQSYHNLLNLIVFVDKWMNKFVRILVYLKTMLSKITKKFDRFSLTWKYFKCQNGNKVMFHLTKFVVEFMILQNGILK